MRNSFFQDKTIPSGARLVGWAALCKRFGLKIPIRNPCCISDHHIKGTVLNEDSFRVFDKRYWPGEQDIDHLHFAFKFEALELLCLKKVLCAMSSEKIQEFVVATPNGKIPRKIWFYYEAFTQTNLDIPDVKKITAIPLLDEKEYYTGPGTLSRRHRVYNNHLGNPNFTPIIRKTETIENFISQNFAEKTIETMGKVSKELIGRAASFLLLADSQASFAIEGERPPQNRLERWGKAVLEAGHRELSLEEFERLHHILIPDDRFIPMGLRQEEVFLGERDRLNNPIPEFIGAAQKDLVGLMKDFLSCHERLTANQIHPVLHAVCIAFAFVYIHPLQDGNGRLHRYLLHHVLAARNFTPSGFVFPLSSAMLERIDQYQAVLRGHSAPLMNSIDWEPNDKGNVTILNETADLYRYYDCTEEVEFIFSCIEHTIKVSLPQELDYLKKHDRALERIMNKVEMPDQLAKQFILFARQNDGKISRKRREREFAKLSEEEIKDLEEIVEEEFSDS